MVVNLSRVQLAAIVVLAVAAIAIIMWRPAQLTVHPVPAASIDNGVLPTPRVPVRLRPRPLVYVAGAVVHPGVYAVSEDARARDALAQAGGAMRDADLVAVNLAAHINDGDELAVPRQGDPPLVQARTTRRATGRRPRGRGRRRPPADGSRATSAAMAETASAPIDLNTADAEALADLPGIGPTLAERIVAFRALNGPFESVDGLADVAGITPSHLDELETLVTVGR